MNKPSDYSLTQQRLKGLRPVLTPIKTIICFFVLSLILFICFAINFYFYETLFWNGHYYGSTRVEKYNILIDKDLLPPVYVFYEITSFDQNNQRYFVDQNYSAFKERNDPSVCNFSSDIYPTNPKYNMACSFFTDKLSLINFETEPPEEIAIRTTDLVFSFDKSQPNYINLTDPEIVWAKIGALPTFAKTYGIIDKAIPSGNYNVTILSNFKLPQVSQKRFIFQKTNPISVRDVYIVMTEGIAGGLLFVFAMFLLLLECLCSRKLGSYRLVGNSIGDQIKMAYSSSLPSSEGFAASFHLPMHLLSTPTAVAAAPPSPSPPSDPTPSS